MAVITDRKRGQGSSVDIEWFAADVLTAQQYYPFGMLMPEDTSANVRRQYSLNTYDYRYGFNGKEGDDEVKGDDNQQDYGMRIYDPRVARFLSVDPLAREYPWYTPYQFAGNMPIGAVDLDGLEEDKKTGTSPNASPIGESITNYKTEDSSTGNQRPSLDNTISIYVAPKNRSKKDSPFGIDWGLQPSYLQAKVTNWKVIEVTDINDAIVQLEKIASEQKIDNLIFDSHGVYTDPRFYIGSTKITDGTGTQLEKIGTLLSYDAKVCLLACHAGGGANPENSESLLKNTSKSLNATVYGSMSWTSSLSIFTGNPSQRNPERSVGEQPNADRDVGLWRKVAKGSNSIIKINKLDITLKGSILEGSEIQNNNQQDDSKNAP